jgi:hypothetical protein
MKASEPLTHGLMALLPLMAKLKPTTIVKIRKL